MTDKEKASQAAFLEDYGKLCLQYGLHFEPDINLSDEDSRTSLIIYINAHVDMVGYLNGIVEYNS